MRAVLPSRPQYSRGLMFDVPFGGRGNSMTVSTLLALPTWVQQGEHVVLVSPTRREREKINYHIKLREDLQMLGVLLPTYTSSC